MAERIGVGIVGASPSGGWAAAVHLPALARLDEYAVTAVATTNPASARAAVEAFGVPHGFADAGELAAHPGVDLVVVSVKAPAHAPAIRAALAAGKHVYCEWPLGVDLAEATGLAAAAATAGVVHAVGLQGYHSPSARYLRDLVLGGRIGTLASVSMVAGGDPLGGPTIPRGLSWATDRAAGNTVLTIMVGHALSVLEQAAGAGPAEVSAVLATLHDKVTVAGTGVGLASDAPGQVAVLGRLPGGAVLSLSVHGGSAPEPDGFLIKLAGTAGTLTVTPAYSGHYPGWADWRIRYAGVDGTATDLPVPSSYRTVPGEVPVANVAALYREIAAAIVESRPAHPNFDTAVHHHRTLAAIERAARTGTWERA